MVGTPLPWDCVMVEVSESSDLPCPDAAASSASDEDSLPHGPWYRHILWMVGVTAAGMGFGLWAAVASGSRSFAYWLSAGLTESMPYLLTWTLTGLVVAGVVRAVDSEVRVLQPTTFVVVLVLSGSGFSMQLQPEASALGTFVAAALTVTVIWCTIARSRNP